MFNVSEYPEISFTYNVFALVLNNLLLIAATAAVFLGTIYPLLLDAFTGEKVSVGPPFYSIVIFPFICRSAEHETPIPTGLEAPGRGRRMTRTSWQKYFPPNCAPIPRP